MCASVLSLNTYKHLLVSVCAFSAPFLCAVCVFIHDFIYVVCGVQAVQIFGTADASDDAAWIELAPRTVVKPFAGNSKSVDVSAHQAVELKRIKVVIFPDGGINRIHVMAKQS